MKTANLSRPKPLWLALLVSGLLGLGGVVNAAESVPANGTPAGNRPTAEVAKPAAETPKAGTETAKPIPPSTAETVDSAFKKLAAGKDHIAKEDAKLLDGFAKVFDAADTNHDGRLAMEEFKKAWPAYTASDKSNRG